MALLDKTGQKRVGLTLDEKLGATALSFYREKSKLPWITLGAMNALGMATLMLSDGAKPMLTFSAFADGSGGIQALDKGQIPRWGMTKLKTGDCSMGIYDASGTPIWRAPSASR